MDKIKLDYRNIFDYSQDPIEYMFIDKADVVPGESAVAIKNLSMQDWFFRIHFPGDPIMPGTMLMEAVMEAGTLVISTLPEKAKKRIFFNGCSNVKITGQARPGDVLNIFVNMEKYRRGIASFSGNISIDARRILEMNFVLVVEDEIVALPSNMKFMGGGVNYSDFLLAYFAFFCRLRKSHLFLRSSGGNVWR